MPLSLHAAFVPSALQTLNACDRLLGKAEAWCTENGKEPEFLIKARLHQDMLPFSYQIKSVAAHTAGAVAGVRAGVFTPDLTRPPEDFAGLAAALGKAREALETLGEDELEAHSEGPMRFEMGETRIDFTAADFLLSFSQPNFYFHAATAYGIMRMKGVPLGKRDYLGRLRTAAR
ncbi:DUF1993 domain-containing protein [Qipengyuania sediminis]|uniref:DUF1993 domain-containing protein n=1 Tax=Qipengyuania sediminis TaxID=1532023 RepID=UPI001059A040|nr:DUF1993 domain-containing protein [Qipengyuania sediminis]